MDYIRGKYNHQAVRNCCYSKRNPKWLFFMSWRSISRRVRIFSGCERKCASKLSFNYTKNTHTRKTCIFFKLILFFVGFSPEFQTSGILTFYFFFGKKTNISENLADFSFFSVFRWDGSSLQNRWCTLCIKSTSAKYVGVSLSSCWHFMYLRGNILILVNDEVASSFIVSEHNKLHTLKCWKCDFIFFAYYV